MQEDEKTPLDNLKTSLYNDPVSSVDIRVNTQTGYLQHQCLLERQRNEAAMHVLYKVPETLRTPRRHSGGCLGSMVMNGGRGIKGKLNETTTWAQRKF